MKSSLTIYVIFSKDKKKEEIDCLHAQALHINLLLEFISERAKKYCSAVLCRYYANLYSVQVGQGMSIRYHNFLWVT